jgi:hypothetical protein
LISLDTPPYLTTRLLLALDAGSPKIIKDSGCIFVEVALLFVFGFINVLWRKDEDHQQVQFTSAVLGSAV